MAEAMKTKTKTAVRPKNAHIYPHLLKRMKEAAPDASQSILLNSLLSYALTQYEGGNFFNGEE